MRLTVILYAASLAGMAGCSTESPVEGGSKSPIVGTWTVRAATLAGVRLSGLTLYTTHSVPLAINVISDDHKDGQFVDWTRVKAEFRPDGTCSLHNGTVKDEGIWTLDTATLTQSYRNKTGKPGIVTWDGRDQFTLVSPDGTSFAFARER